MKQLIKISTPLFLFFLLAGCSYRGVYEKAEALYYDMSYAKASVYYEKVADRPEFPLAKNMLADCYGKMNNNERREYWLRKVVESTDSDNRISHLLSDELNFAKILISNGKYEEASFWLEKYLSEVPDDADASDLLSTIESIREFYADSGLYTIKLLDINSESYSSFGAAYFKDGLIFSSEMPSGEKQKICEWTGRPFLDLFFARILPDNTLDKPELLKGKINNNFHQGPATFAKNGKTIYLTSSFFVKKNKPGGNTEGVNILRIYTSSEKMGEWGPVTEVPIIEQELFSVGHPALSPENDKLYLISDMEGGYGGTDIYVCERKVGKWGAPENLGPAINTPGNEMFPFISANGTLYFSSNGLKGMGGLDVFSSVKTGNNWTKPINLGFPINSPGDDIGFVINPENEAGFFSSNRESPEGIDFLYSFRKNKLEFAIKGRVVNKENKQPLKSVTVELYRDSKPVKNITTDSNGNFDFPVEKDASYSVVASNQFSVADRVFSTKNKKQSETFQCILELFDPDIHLVGRTFEQESKKNLKDVKIFVKNSEGKILVQDLLTDAGGLFTIPLDLNQTYMIYGFKDGYFTKSIEVSTIGKGNSDDLFASLGLEKIILLKPIRVDNIFYDLDKWNIRPDAKPELNKLVNLLEDNPTLIVELGSHCDSRGSDSYNMTLSEKRAESAVNYFVSNGIDPKRIVARGYGESKLLNNCTNGVKCQENDHQFNRRTEISVIGFVPQPFSEL